MKRLIFLGCLFLLGSASGLSQATAPEEPLSFLQRRAEAGDPKAQNELGVRYRVGDGVEKDEAKALGWYRSAAKQGFALAYFNLGTAFYNGDGVAPNDGLACAWFLLSAEGGEPSGKAAYERVSASHENSGGAVCEVLAGDAYINGTEIPQNLAKGLDLYTKAADAGNGAAALRIAYLYMKGIGVPRDPASVLQWLNVAAKRQERQAYHLLGKVYETGDGVPVDLRKACQAYSEGTRSEATDSILALGDLVRDGRGASQNLRQAFLLYAHAKRRGDKSAEARMVELTNRMPKKQAEQLLGASAQYRIEMPHCK